MLVQIVTMAQQEAEAAILSDDDDDDDMHTLMSRVTIQIHKVTMMMMITI